MGPMSTLTRIKVVVTAAPTYLVLVSTAVAVASTELATVLPNYAALITRITGPIVSALAVAVILVRSVTTVLPEHRKLTSAVPYGPVDVPADPSPEPVPVPGPVTDPKFDRIP